MKLQMSCRFVACLVVIAIFALSGRYLGAGDSRREAPNWGVEQENQYTKFSATLRNLKNGQEKPTAKDRLENGAIDYEAKYLVYRFWHAPAGDWENPKKGTKKLVADFKSTIELIEAKDPEVRKKTRMIAHDLSEKLAVRFRDLLEQDIKANAYPIVNAAPMLVEAARMKDEAIGNCCADLIAGKDRSDAVKLHAIRALREYTPMVATEGGVLAQAVANRKAREVRYADALVNFIERKVDGKLSVPEQNAIRFVRREALETLAGASVPCIFADKAKIEGPIAPTLLRVLAPKSGLDVPPGLGEKIEAAIGVCQLKFIKNKNNPTGEFVDEYQPEIGVYLVGKFIHEFCTEYNIDLVKIRENKPAILHWKLHSKRLEAALKEMSANAKGHAVSDKAVLLEKSATPLFGPMQEKTYGQINQGGLQQYGILVKNKLMPSTKQAFKSHKSSAIDFDEPTPAADAAPEK